MIEAPPLLRRSLFRVDDFTLITIQEPDTLAAQEEIEPVCSSIAAATDADDLLHANGHSVVKHLVVVPGSREKIVVKGIGSQLKEFVSTKPCCAPAIRDRDEVSNQRIRIAAV
jgi:hypothetical protein